MEEPVDEGVGLESGDGGGRLAAVVAGEHVMPLQDLVEHDAVDEPAEADAYEKGGELGGRVEVVPVRRRASCFSQSPWRSPIPRLGVRHYASLDAVLACHDSAGG